jgi:hypothetical protein
MITRFQGFGVDESCSSDLSISQFCGDFNQAIVICNRPVAAMAGPRRSSGPALAAVTPVLDPSPEELIREDRAR